MCFLSPSVEYKLMRAASRSVLIDQTTQAGWVLRGSTVWARLRSAGFLPKEKEGIEGLGGSDMTRFAF